MSSDRSKAKQSALILIGRRRDLLQLQGRADLPARFFGVFEGSLEETASIGDEGELDGFFERFRVVGLDSDLLLSTDQRSERDQRYLDNLGQKLAARRVVILTVLRDRSECEASCTLELGRLGETVSGTVAVRPDADRVIDLQKRFARSGFEFGYESDEAGARVRLTLEATDGSVLTTVGDAEGGQCGQLLDFALPTEGESSALVSRWLPFPAEGFESRSMHELLRECLRCRESESLDGLQEAWRSAVSRMQADTRAKTRLELVVVAERPLEREDEARIRAFESLGRTWMMTDRLRVSGDSQTLVRARHVWPDALGILLARLSVGDQEHVPGGVFAWRGIACGVGLDASGVEQKRALHTQRVLDGQGDAKSEPRIERTGPFEPIESGPAGDDAVRPSVRWTKGDARGVVRRVLDEDGWRTDHRRAGHELGLRRLSLDRAVEGGDPADEGTDAADPESVYSQQYWRLVHSSPQQLRVFGTARLFRDDNIDLRERLAEHLREWREEVLGRRRKLASDRVRLEQHAEEVDLARRFHLGIAWRACIGSAVAIYAGFLALYVLRVFLVFSPGSWVVGAWMFVAALTGGWLGAVLPAWIERKQGVRAARAVELGLEKTADQHLDGVRETHEVFRDAESVRQSIRMSAIHRRTTLLANRAWTVVTRARDAVAREFEQRKLLGEAVGPRDDAERLAVEDLREWRGRAVLRPKPDEDELALDPDQLKVSIQKVAEDFNQTWQTRLDREDPKLTGFLRIAVLDRLVRDLSDDVAACLEQQLLDQLQRRFVEGLAEVDPEFWVTRMLATIGFDASDHALLSVLDDDVPQRPEGQYRILRRDVDFAQVVCRTVRDRRRGFADRESEIVEHLPPGAFAMVFHAVPLTWEDGRLRIDQSEFRAPTDPEPPSGTETGEEAP